MPGARLCRSLSLSLLRKQSCVLPSRSQAVPASELAFEPASEPTRTVLLDCCAVPTLLEQPCGLK